MTVGSHYLGPATVIVCGPRSTAGDLVHLTGDVRRRSVSGEIIVFAVPNGVEVDGAPEELVVRVGPDTMWAHGWLNRLSRMLERRTRFATVVAHRAPRATFTLSLSLWLMRVGRVLPALTVVAGSDVPPAAFRVASLVTRRVHVEVPS